MKRDRSCKGQETLHQVSDSLNFQRIKNLQESQEITLVIIVFYNIKDVGLLEMSWAYREACGFCSLNLCYRNSNRACALFCFLSLVQMDLTGRMFLRTLLPNTLKKCSSKSSSLCDRATRIRGGRGRNGAHLLTGNLAQSLNFKVWVMYFFSKNPLKIEETRTLKASVLESLNQLGLW